MEAAEEARLALGEHHVPLRPKAELGDPFQDVEGKAEFLKSDAPLLDGGKRPPAKLPALLKEGDKKAGVKGVPEDLGHRTLRVGKLRAQGTSKELKVLRRPVKEMNEHLEKLRDNIEGMMAEKSSTNAKEIGKTLEYAESVRTARVMGGGGGGGVATGYGGCLGRGRNGGCRTGAGEGGGKDGPAPTSRRALH